MENIEIIAAVLTGVLAGSIIIGGLLSMWLKGKLQDLVTSLEVLNNTVNYFIKGHEDLERSQERIEKYAQNNRERIVVTESKVNSLHSRIDRFEENRDYDNRRKNKDIQ